MKRRTVARVTQRKAPYKAPDVAKTLALIESAEELADLRTSLQKTAAIYFLFLGDEIVYVGQSLDVTYRLIMHRERAVIPFDSFAVIPVPAEHLSWYERRAIRQHRPRFNTHVPLLVTQRKTLRRGTKGEKKSELPQNIMSE